MLAGDGFLRSQDPQRASSDALLIFLQALVGAGNALHQGSAQVPWELPHSLGSWGGKEECLMRATSKLGGEGGLQMLVNTALLVRNAVLLLLLQPWIYEQG